MALGLRQNFVSIQYLENNWIEFHLHIYKIYIGMLHIIFSHICTRVMALNLGQNFLSVQYLQNKWTEFHQILYMQSYWQNLRQDCYTSFLLISSRVMARDLLKKISAQYLKEKWTDFDQTLYDCFILTRSTLGLLAVIFRKFVRELCPSIDVRITLPLNILRNSVLLLYAKHCSGAIVRFSYNSSLAHLCRRLIGKLIVYQSLLHRPSVVRPSTFSNISETTGPI